MWSELNLICLQMELFEQFAGVSMSEDRVCGEIVSRMHEVGLRRRSFSSSAYAGFCIADNAMIDIDQASLKQGRKCEDDRGGIASGVGNEVGLADLVAMKFRTSVDCSCLELP